MRLSIHEQHGILHIAVDTHGHFDLRELFLGLLRGTLSRSHRAIGRLRRQRSTRRGRT